MALNKIETIIALDVYDHDNTAETIKSIACDDNSRYVAAEIQYQGIYYDIGSSAKVSLTVLRPDGTGVTITGDVYEITATVDGDELDENDDPIQVEINYYGCYSELDIDAICVEGTLLGQFKIESGDQVLRTELFKINNGRALDVEITDWAGSYQGYNLDEIVEKLDFVVAALKDLTGSDVDIDQAILNTHYYIDNKISVHDGGIYINS